MTPTFFVLTSLFVAFGAALHGFVLARFFSTRRRQRVTCRVLLSLLTIAAAAQDIDPAVRVDCNGEVFALAVQPDGRLVFDGTFTLVGTQPRGRLARLDRQGRLDSGFLPEVTGSVHALAVQAGGEIVLGGSFGAVNGTPRSGVARIFEYGGLDPNFRADLGSPGTPIVRTLAVQRNGGILAGGNFDTAGGLPRVRLARMTSSGTVDAAYRLDATGNIAGDALTFVHAIIVQADARVVVGGDFAQLGGQPRSGIARLAADGSLENTFTPGASPTVRALLSQPDRRTLVGGMRRIDGRERALVARLNVDGSLDPSFAATLDPAQSGWVDAIALQPDGKVLVAGGNFMTTAGQSRTGLIRFNADGTFDPTFDARLSGALRANSVTSVSAVAVLPDGRIAIGGNFAAVGGVPRRGLAVLLPTSPSITVQPGAVAVNAGNSVVLAASAIGSGNLAYQWFRDGAPVAGATQARLEVPEADASASGTYVLRVSNASGSTDSEAAVVGVGRAPRLTYRFATLAGRAGGHLDGPGPTARFNVPVSGASDAAGNLFIADAVNHVIRRIDTAGTVTTFAGQPGRKGSADGLASEARFFFPLAVATDATGNVYVVDGFNHTLRRISPLGVVTTLAGSPGEEGSRDGDGAAARFRFTAPGGIAVDAAGNLLVADSGNHTIRRVTATGIVSTLAGNAEESGYADGAGVNALFHHPAGLAWDPAGNVLVADSGNFCVRRIAPDGTVTVLAGRPREFGSADGIGVLARFGTIEGIAVDRAGVAFVADSANATIRRITAGGVVSTFAGSMQVTGMVDGSGTTARFQEPSGVAFDPMGNLIVCDPGAHVVRRISAAAAVTTLAGAAGGYGHVDGAGGAARFELPHGLAISPDGMLYVADANNHVIRRITPDGVTTTLAGTAGSFGFRDGAGAAARFNHPAGLTIDPAGNLLVTDRFNRAIRRITPAGAVTTVAGDPENFGLGNPDGVGRAARFSQAMGVAVDAGGSVFVADTGYHTIRRISTSGTVSTLAGAASFPGSADGPASVARFLAPHGIAVGPAGTLVVADTENHTIRRIAPDGSVSTLAGTAGRAGSVDGVGAAALFHSPRAVAVDEAGNVFVADTNNHAVRRITPDGVVTTIAGLGAQPGSIDGRGPAARFLFPSGIAVGPDVRVYVSDTDNHAIRVGVPLAEPRLANLSVRSTAGTGDDALVVGFSLTGRGNKRLLLRAVGPTLAQFGVTGVLPNPTLHLDRQAAAVVAQNDDWETPIGDGAAAAGIRAAAAAVGAFPLGEGGRDAALLQTLDIGTYTAQVGGGSGVALVEAYDAGTDAAARLANLSVRTRFEPTASDLVVGLVVGGDIPLRVLIRAVGPGLAQFGLAGALADPRLTLTASGNVRVAENDNWGGTGVLQQAFRDVGAFALPATSRDSAMIVTLLPGAYTVQLGAAASDSGIVLVEAYDVP